MKAKELTKNLRIEYAVVAPGVADRGKTKIRRHSVGYVKRVYRKWFTTWVEICESRTRRIDTVKLKDVFGVVEAKFQPKPSPRSIGENAKILPIKK